jgi:hypothetical protein
MIVNLVCLKINYKCVKGYNKLEEVETKREVGVLI